MAFLPKIVFWVVLDVERVAELLKKLGAAVRLNGAPVQSAAGFAVVAEIGKEVPVGYSPMRINSAHQPEVSGSSAHESQVVLV